MDALSLLIHGIAYVNHNRALDRRIGMYRRRGLNGPMPSSAKAIVELGQYFAVPMSMKIVWSLGGPNRFFVLMK
jgi:hypothetical protein